MLIARKRKLLTVSISLLWFAQYVYVPFQTPYLESLHAQAAYIGVIVGAYGITQTLLRIPLGIFADRYRRHKIFIVLGIACSGLASVARLLSPTPEGFLVGNMFSGVAAAAWISFTIYYAALFRPDEATKAMGYSMAASNTGIFIAFILGTYLHKVGGMSPIFIASIASGALGVLVALAVREDKPGPLLAPPPKLKLVIRSRRLWYYSVLALCLQAIVITTALAFTASYLKQHTDSELMLGVSASVFIASSAISGLLAGHIKRIGSHTLLTLLFSLLLVYCALMPLCREVWQICALQVACGLGNGAAMSVLMALGMEGVDPHGKSTAMGFFQAMFGVGTALGPMMVGVLIQWSGYKLGYWTLAAIAIACIVAFQFPPQSESETAGAPSPQSAVSKAP